MRIIFKWNCQVTFTSLVLRELVSEHDEMSLMDTTMSFALLIDQNNSNRRLAVSELHKQSTG